MIDFIIPVGTPYREDVRELMKAVAAFEAEHPEEEVVVHFWAAGQHIIADTVSRYADILKWEDWPYRVKPLDEYSYGYVGTRDYVCALRPVGIQDL